MSSPSLPRPARDLNVTPMIDVLLVLLVIFIVTLPLTQRGLDTTLPPAGEPPNPTTTYSDNVVVEYTADRQLAINKRPASMETLEADLRQIFVDRRDKRLFIIGDGSLRYGDIVAVIDAAKGAGVQAVGIVTEGMRRAAGAI